MKLKIVVVVLAVLLYVPAGLLGADYIAGAMVYVTNKRVPEDVSLSTWPEAWQAYREDATQRKRLQFSAGERCPAFDPDLGEQGIIVGKVGRRYLIYGGQEFVLLAAPT